MLGIEGGDARVADDAFCAFFTHATGVKAGPYPYQKKLAAEPVAPGFSPAPQSRLIHVPTGAGKTAVSGSSSSPYTSERVCTSD
jgi:hypothetical protein